MPVLRQRHPEMQLSYHTMMETELITALEKQQIDVAFLSGMPADAVIEVSHQVERGAGS